MIDSAIKWHGGKHYLRKELWMLTEQIKHIHRVEVFGGSLGYTLACDPEGVSEVVNDANGPLMNFWRVLRDPVLFSEFRRQIECVPVSEQLWNEAEGYHRIEHEWREPIGTCAKVNEAVTFFVNVRQSMSARRDCFTPLTKKRVRRGMNAEVSAWLSAIEGLPEVHARLIRVVMLWQDWTAVLHSQDSYGTLLYLDPPYLPETRATVGEYGLHEMTPEQHANMLYRLTLLRGNFILSGYHSDLYDSWAERNGYQCFEVVRPNASGKGEEKQDRVECIWTSAKDIRLIV